MCAGNVFSQCKNLIKSSHGSDSELTLSSLEHLIRIINHSLLRATGIDRQARHWGCWSERVQQAHVVCRVCKKCFIGPSLAALWRCLADYKPWLLAKYRPWDRWIILYHSVTLQWTGFSFSFFKIRDCGCIDCPCCFFFNLYLFTIRNYLTTWNFFTLNNQLDVP